MEKLQYDSLYKFLVSLGVVLFASPIAILLLILRSDTIVISQEDYDLLSEYTISQLQIKSTFFKHINSLSTLFIILAIIIMLVGLIFIGFGIYKWNNLQKYLDEQIIEDTKIKKQTYIDMTSGEILKKADEEYKESVNENNTSSADLIRTDPRLKYLEIEDEYFNYITSQFPYFIRRKTIFKRNVRVGKYEYDYIFIPKEKNTDLLFEIKYWKRPMQTKQIIDTLYRVIESGRNYRTETGREFIYKLVIITNSDMLDRMKKSVNRIIENNKIELENIQIEYVDEETIKKAD